MFHKFSLGLSQIVCPFLLRFSIVFLDAKTNNQIFDAHLLSLMLEIIIEVFPSRWQLLNNSCNLKSFAQHHSLSMYLMENYLKFLDLTDHSLGIYRDAPFPRVPLTTRQPAEYSWMSGNPTPLMKIGQSLLCMGSSTQDTQLVPTFYTDHTGSTYG